MATKTYHYDRTHRAINGVYRRLTLLGLGARYRHLLTVTGRRTGRAITTPIDVMTVRGERWLVAPYGVSQWVHNVRADPLVTLQRGRVARRYRAEEADAASAVPVIRAYIRAVRVTHGYWAADPDATNSELMRVAAGHPVFRLTPLD